VLRTTVVLHVRVTRSRRKSVTSCRRSCPGRTFDPVLTCSMLRDAGTPITSVDVVLAGKSLQVWLLLGCCVPLVISEVRSGA
jgi:hypothetical protein